MSLLAPQGDSDTPERHGRAPLRTEEPRSQPIVGPGGSAKEQEEPSRLHGTHQRNSFQKRLVFRHLTHQLRLDEFVMPHWRSQHDDALLHDWQTMVPSPNDCIWVQGPSSSGKILASSGCGPTAVPELRLAAMHADPGVDPQCVLDETENLQHPLWFAIKIHDVQKGKKLFTFSEEITGADERRVHGETEEQWHERILAVTITLEQRSQIFIPEGPWCSAPFVKVARSARTSSSSLCTGQQAGVSTDLHPTGRGSRGPLAGVGEGCQRSHIAWCDCGPPKPACRLKILPMPPIVQPLQPDVPNLNRALMDATSCEI